MGRIGKRRPAGWRKRRVDAIVRQQLAAFREKFGRDPLPDEPMFFDPDQDEPTPLSEKVLEDAAMEFLEGAPPWIIYAYKKTELILLAELRDTYPPEVVAEYDAAIEEYFELEKAGKLP